MQKVATLFRENFTKSKGYEVSRDGAVGFSRQRWYFLCLWVGAGLRGRGVTIHSQGWRRVLGFVNW